MIIQTEHLVKIGLNYHKASVLTQVYFIATKIKLAGKREILMKNLIIIYIFIIVNSYTTYYTDDKEYNNLYQR